MTSFKHGVNRTKHSADREKYSAGRAEHRLNSIRIWISVFFCLVLFVNSCVFMTYGAQTQTDSQDPSGQPESQGQTLQVVAEIFPIYDWLINIIGENNEHAEVSLLIGSGTDMHSYQPGIQDIVKLTSCDMLVYIGGESDQWVSDAVLNSAGDDIKAVRLLDLLGDAALEEEELPGLEEEFHTGEESSSFSESAGPAGRTGLQGEDPVAGEEAEYDEHIWLSLKNAWILCEQLADVLSELDPENAAVYQANALQYTEKLKALDSRYEELISASPVKTLLFADRFPFIYLVRDYGLEYYAAFEGCSAETEASFSTIVFLTGKCDELGLRHILVIDGSDEQLARTVAQSTKEGNREILTLDSMQSVTERQIEEGISYLDIMEQNLEILKEVLQS